MHKSFIIMQIGNEEMDGIYRSVFVPVLTESCGSKPNRVDKHNRGELLKTEIIRFIESSDIILADLTNERPNCYLEVGIAMGLGKYTNLILTSRDDHKSDHPKFDPSGPKIHFDLMGYDILFWDPANPEEFRTRLKSKIEQRLRLIQGKSTDFPQDSETSTYDKHRHLQNLITERTPISITPIFPLSKRESEFLAKEIVRESDILRLTKLDSDHTIQIPIQKIKTILPSRSAAVTLELNGRLQLLSLSSEWRFFPEAPDDNDLGVGKRGSLTDPRVNELSKKMGAHFFPLNVLAKFQHLGWQILYDNDGKYIRMPDRSSDQILCFGGRRI